MRQPLFLFLKFQIQPVDDTDDGSKDDAADDLSEIDHVLTFLVLVQEGRRHGQVRCALVIREGLLDALLEFVFHYYNKTITRLLCNIKSYILTG